MTEGGRLWVEVWFWEGIPPESRLRRKMVNVLRGEMTMEILI